MAMNLVSPKLHTENQGGNRQSSSLSLPNLPESFLLTLWQEKGRSQDRVHYIHFTYLLFLGSPIRLFLNLACFIQHR